MLTTSERYRTVLEQNIRLHRTEAYFYDATHPENFNVFEQARLKRELRRLAGAIGPGRPVLDIASGTGNIARHLEKMGVPVVACDLSPEMLHENPARHRVLCDVTRLPFRSGSFAAVTSYSVFHHLPDPCQALEEVARVSAEDGVLYLDHDHFLPHRVKALGHYPFTATDLLGWGLWLLAHPRHLRRLWQYARWGRRRHLRNISGLDKAEDHQRVDTPAMVTTLERAGFRVELFRHRGGSALRARRGAWRVAHLGTGLWPVEAGAARSVENTIYELSRHLAGAGCQVDVVDIRPGRQRRGPHRGRFTGLRALPLGGTSPASFLLRALVFSVQALPALRRLAGQGIEIVHAHSQFPAAAALLARRLFRAGYRVAYTAHSPYLLAPPTLSNRLAHLLLEGWVLRRVDLVFAQTRSFGHGLARRFHLPPGKVIPVYAGVDIEKIDGYRAASPPATARQTPCLLYPAIISPRKNQLALVEAMPAVLREFPDARLTLPGATDDPAYRQRLQERVARLGLDGRVEMPGHLPQEALYQLYTRASLLVFPSLQESQGVVLLEAMAFGLPVLASDIGPVADVAAEMEGAIRLVDAGHPGRLAGGIITLLRDEAARRRLAATGRRLVEQRFTWQRAAADTLKAYHNITRQRPTNHPSEV